jgi:hypothetical protein
LPGGEVGQKQSVPGHIANQVAGDDEEETGAKERTALQITGAQIKSPFKPANHGLLSLSHARAAGMPQN